MLPIAWLLAVEGLITSALPQAARSWSVGGVTAALQHAGTVPAVLPTWVGGGALLALAVLLLALGATHLHRTDIT